MQEKEMKKKQTNLEMSGLRQKTSIIALSVNCINIPTEKN